MQIDRREGEHGGATGGARQDGIAARRLHRDGSLQRRRAVGDPHLSPAFIPKSTSRSRWHRRHSSSSGLREGALDVVFLRPGAAGAPKSCSFAGSRMKVDGGCPSKGHPAAALEEIDLAMLKDDLFVLFPAGNGADGVGGGCRRLSKSRLRAGRWSARAALFIDRESRGGGARSIDRAGVYDASARGLSIAYRRSCRPVADDRACSGQLPARRDVARVRNFIARTSL